jgi:hypothetical protein
VPLLDDAIGRVRCDIVDDLPTVRTRDQRFIFVPDTDYRNTACVRAYGPRVKSDTLQRWAIPELDFAFVCVTREKLFAIIVAMNFAGAGSLIYCIST